LFELAAIKGHSCTRSNAGKIRLLQFFPLTYAEHAALAAMADRLATYVAEYPVGGFPYTPLQLEHMADTWEELAAARKRQLARQDKSEEDNESSD